MKTHIEGPWSRTRCGKKLKKGNFILASKNEDATCISCLQRVFKDYDLFLKYQELRNRLRVKIVYIINLNGLPQGVVLGTKKEALKVAEVLAFDLIKKKPKKESLEEYHRRVKWSLTETNVLMGG